MGVQTHDNLSSHCNLLVCLSLNSDAEVSSKDMDRHWVETYKVNLNTFFWVFPRKFRFSQNWYKGSFLVLFADVSGRKFGESKTVTPGGCSSLIQPAWDSCLCSHVPTSWQSTKLSCASSAGSLAASQPDQWNGKKNSQKSPLSPVKHSMWLHKHLNWLSWGDVTGRWKWIRPLSWLCWQRIHNVGFLS